MNALKCLLVAACSTALLAPAASYGAEKNAAGFLSYASHDELVKAAKAETGTLQLTIALTQPGIDEIVKLFTATYGIKAVGQDVGQSELPDTPGDQGRNQQKRYLAHGGGAGPR